MTNSPSSSFPPRPLDVRTIHRELAVFILHDRALHSLAAALTTRVPPRFFAAIHRFPFASVSFHPTRHGSISNTTSSTISLDEFFALSRDARATNARRAIVRRGFRPVVIRRATVARASPSSSSSSSRTFETRVSHRLARKTAVLARASSCAVARYRCVGNLMPTVSSSRVVTRR